MNRKENRRLARQAAQQAVLRDGLNRRIHDAAAAPANVLLRELRAPLGGLDPEAVAASRAQYGSNRVTHEKKKLCPDGWPARLSILLPPFSSAWPWSPP